MRVFGAEADVDCVGFSWGLKPPAPSIAALERAARLNKLRKKANFHSMRTRRDPAGAEAPIFNSFIGTTEVVPCYKAFQN
jgi:hypothetical protein